METLDINYGPSFNWYDILKELSDGAQITERDQCRLDERAGNWPACACGQLCTLLPRETDKVPIDPILRQLGISFSDAVSSQHWERALSIFNKIEARSTKLLKAKGIMVELVEHKFQKIKRKIEEQKPFAVRLAEPCKGFKRQTVLQK